ncbi:MAG TPA: DNA polymerase III subunit gamma/tau [Solirubrobacteraceae bacterium]|nr:DNA polymerase III subunit gamma/tau [Solirubrobacteraceae bacterium]
MSALQSSNEQQRSLYRRHRPRTFADVVGQEPVVRTLRNAVERGKVHHAYLFVGSRGTGKTSMAKILAACLNCEHGPTIEPCGECESCLAIASASSLDVIEMDAASNNSVDDIRELRESVAYAPVSGRRKVYILDEAHMLSTAAWNAFLKTLEEPPPNTVFVLATTEAQKVPATVVDRCHRFDFHRPTVEQIASVVRRTAQAEQIEIPAEAVSALARSATGSFRDALGTLEQLVTYSGSEIALGDVLAVLGVTDARLLEASVDAVAEGDARQALQIVATCAEQGRDAASFAVDLEVRARELLVVQTLGEVPSELSLTPEADAALQEQSERVPAAIVVRLLEALGEALEAVRAGADARTRLELALVKAAKPDVDSSLRALLERIERLERGAPIAAVARDAVAPERESAPSEPRGPIAAGVAAAAAPPAPTPGTAETARGGAVPSEAISAQAESTEAVAAKPVATEAVTVADAPAENAAVEPAAAQPQPAPAFAPEHAEAAVEVSVASIAAVPPRAPETQGGSPSAQAIAEGLAPLLAWWPAVVDLVRGDNALLGACIEEAQPVDVKGEDLVVAFSAAMPFHKKKAETPDNRAALTAALQNVTGRRWRVSYELHDGIGAGDGDADAPLSEEEWVKRFIEEFDAEELPGDEAHSSEQKGA